MNKFLSLFKVHLKGIFSFAHFKADLKANKKAIYKPLLAVLLVLMLIPTYVLFFMMISSLLQTFAMFGEAHAVLAMGAVATCLMTLFFGFMYCFSTLFTSKDIEMLLTLPIKGGSIVASKLLCCVVYEYAFVLPLMLPVLIRYAIFASAGIMFWVYSLIMLTAMPFIPLSIAAIIEMLVIRVFGMKVNAEKVQSVFMYVFMAIVIGLQFVMNKMSYAMSGGITDYLAENMSVIKSITSSYFPAKWFAGSLASANSISGLINMLLFVAVSIAVFLLAVYVGEKLYLTSVRTQGINASGNIKAVKFDREKISKDSIKTNSALTIFKADLKVLLRTSVFSMNYIMIIPLLPIIFSVSFFAMGEDQLALIRDLLVTSGNQVGLYIMLFLVFFVGISTTTSTSFSREGKAFWINQIIPVKPVNQLLGRGLTSLLLNTAMFLVIMVPMALIAKWDVFFTILIIITGILYTLPLIPVGLLIDASRPKLDWEDPAKAVKQNFNSVFCWLVSIILCIIGAVLAILSAFKGLNLYLVMLIFALIGVLLTYLFAKRFINKADKLLTFN